MSQCDISLDPGPEWPDDPAGLIGEWVTLRLVEGRIEGRLLGARPLDDGRWRLTFEMPDVLARDLQALVAEHEVDR